MHFNLISIVSAIALILICAIAIINNYSQLNLLLKNTGKSFNAKCYYLDFSESRKDPIKRKIYPFEDEKIGLTHFKNLLDENVKKGWEKYNGS